jgi:hypothetical protein
MNNLALQFQSSLVFALCELIVDCTALKQAVYGQTVAACLIHVVNCSYH